MTRSAVTAGSDQTSDVLSCSVFSKPYHACRKKGCLNMAEAGRVPWPMMPRAA